jgi:hypothetical protein
MIYMNTNSIRFPFNIFKYLSFVTSPTLGSFSRDLPDLRVLPGAGALFVRLSPVFLGRFQTADEVILSTSLTWL